MSESYDKSVRVLCVKSAKIKVKNNYLYINNNKTLHDSFYILNGQIKKTYIYFLIYF